MKFNSKGAPSRKAPREDFIDAFYGDVERSLCEEDTSSNTLESGSVVDTTNVVSSLEVLVKARSKDSTLEDACSEYTYVSVDESKDHAVKQEACLVESQGSHHPTKGEFKSSNHLEFHKKHRTKAHTSKMGFKTAEEITNIREISKPRIQPLGLGTPPKKTKITKIRAVEPAKRNLSQVPSAHILGYRDFPQHQAMQRLHATTPAPNPAIQQEEDRMHKRKANRVLFVLALIAVICFAMIAAVIILVVLNHLSRNTTTDETDPIQNGRLFLGSNSNPGYVTNPVPTSSPTMESVQVDDPILSSLFQRNPAIASCPNGALQHSDLPGKKGIGLPLREEGRSGSWTENIPRLKLLNVYWNYSYDAKRIVQQPDDIEFVPMIWGGVNVQWLQYTIKTHILPQIRTGEAKRLLGFHEPDESDQANMSVDDALMSWRELQAAGLPMISPATANPGGLWMNSFMSKIDSDCLRSEWVAIHWFDIPSFDLFRDSLVNYHLLYGRPILLTEFAPIDRYATSIQDHRWSEEVVLDFMKAAVPWLESTPWIQGYSWFSFDINDPVGKSSALFDDEGSLTACGRYYASIRTDLPNGDIRIGALGDATNIDESTDGDQHCATAWKSEPFPLPGKKGLAMKTNAEDNTVTWLHEIANMDGMGVAWTYNFESESFSNSFGTPLFLPSIANEQQALSMDLSMNTPINRIIGFDRPDKEYPNFLSVQSALDLWSSLEATEIPLVSPVCNDPLGQWMRSFMATADTTCRRVDWIGVRWQGSANFHNFKKAITDIYQVYQRPLMVMEISLDNGAFHSVPEALTFMKQTIPWLEQTSYVDGYAWLSNLNSTSSLFHADGSLSSCGKFYASVSMDNPQGDQSILPEEIEK